MWSLLNQIDLPKYVSDYDIILLTETFSDRDLSECFPDYIHFICPGVKISNSVHGRVSGGLALMVRKSLSNFVNRITIEYDNMIALRLIGSLFGLENDVILLGAYLPPETSDYYAETEIYNGVSMIEDALLELSEMYINSEFLLFGDFNARIGTENSTFCNNPYTSIHDVLEKDTDEQNLKRVSNDISMNAFGKYLINVCNNFGLTVMNGYNNFDFSGNFTYVSNTGCSVIDLFIVSNNLVKLCESLNVLPIVESKHASVTLNMVCELHSTDTLPENNKCQKYKKFKWKKDKKCQFEKVLNSEYFSQGIQKAITFIESDIDLALDTFNNCLYRAGECMKINVNMNNDRPRNVWFDLECFQSRKVLRQHLRRFNRFNRDDDRIAYSEKRKEYKKLLVQKNQEKKNEQLHMLQNNINDPSIFWSCVQSILKQRQNFCCISVREWHDHFFSVFNSKHYTTNTFCDFSTGCELDDDDCSSLEDPISENEIKAAIQGLKNKKAPGPDGLINEFYKESEGIIMPFLLKFFNHLFDNGLFPNEWTLSVLQPLHKKGDINIPDNYRGISLLNVCSKVYSSVLNRRLTDFVEDNDILGEEQAGYRCNRSPIEQIFTLYAIISKQLIRHRKLYVAFIDFKKAFDGISRVKLWLVLRKLGIKGKMLDALKNMYKSVKTKVRFKGNFTDYFDCPNGLKQGEICSPIIFSLFIHELTKEMRKYGRHGIQLCPDIFHVLILLFADDVALISDSVIGLQNQLNILSKISRKLDLIVNLDKSNIIVFRNGGHLSNVEKWTFEGNKLTVINSYKYLGIYLSTRLSFTTTFEDLAARGKKGVIGILRALWTIGDHTPSVFFKLFDSQIQPILTYGAEIWGLTKNQEIIERVHLFAIKKFLGVHIKTPRQFVYGDSGRYPLYIVSYIKCIKFWLKLTRHNDSRLCKKAYNMLLFLQRQNFVTWLDNVRNVLYRYGFGVVWETQCVGRQDVFIKCFKQRLIDCAGQEWHCSLDSKDFFYTYSLFKRDLKLEYYITNVTNFWHRKSLTRFRFGMLEINGSFLKFNRKIPEKNQMCPNCKDVKETEIHLLFVCPLYDNLRLDLIPQKFYRRPSASSFSILVASPIKCLNIRVAEFIYKALKIRTIFLYEQNNS